MARVPCLSFTRWIALEEHEFFHAVQWTYQRACPQISLLQITTAWWRYEDLRWWMEATAVWAQHKPIPSVTKAEIHYAHFRI